MKKLLLAAIVGAALMWFYDPANGTQRRDALQRKLNKVSSSPVDQPSRLTPEGTPRTDVAMFAAR